MTKQSVITLLSLFLSSATTIDIKAAQELQQTAPTATHIHTDYFYIKRSESPESISYYRISYLEKVTDKATFQPTTGTYNACKSYKNEDTLIRLTEADGLDAQTMFKDLTEHYARLTSANFAELPSQN